MSLGRKEISDQSAYIPIESVSCAVSQANPSFLSMSWYYAELNDRHAAVYADYLGVEGLVQSQQCPDLLDSGRPRTRFRFTGSSSVGSSGGGGPRLELSSPAKQPAILVVALLSTY